jgi:hypothetical protein
MRNNHSVAQARASTSAGARVIMPAGGASAPSQNLISRRSIMLGSVACVAIPSSPSLAASSPGGSNEPQDAEILALGAELDAALAIYEPLSAELGRLEKIYRSRDSRPRALLVQKGDQLLLDQHLSVGIGYEYYPAHVQILRSVVFTRAIGRSTGPSAHDVSIDFVPDTKATARAAEIVKAYDEYSRRTEKLANDIGLTDIQRRFEKAYDEVSPIVDRVLAAPASTLAGLRVRARAAAWCHDGVEAESDDATDARLAWSIVRDLLQAAA